jgi:hypothetical protein
MYIQTANAQVNFGVYTDNNGQPDTLLAQTQTVTTTGNNWTTATISVPIEAGQNYWLTTTSTSTIHFNYDFGTVAAAGSAQTAAVGVLDSTYGDFLYWSPSKFSIYATYTPTNPTTTPTSTPTQTLTSTNQTTTETPNQTTTETTETPTSGSTSSNIPAGLSKRWEATFESGSLQLDLQ